jgi:TRAP transporter TAXI family solute receptor
VVAIFVAAAAVVVLGVLALVVGGDRQPPSIVIATGSEGEAYHALGLAVARLLEEEGVVTTAEVVTTDGSVANMELLGGPHRVADLGFVQSDTRPSDGVRLIAPLYHEELHILVSTRSTAGIESIGDLDGRRVALGAPGSGTRSVAQRVLDHFGIEVGEDLALRPEATAGGLEDGTIDVAFMLSAIPSKLVEGLCARDAVRFLSLGDPQLRGNEADALALVFPSLESAVIPRWTYVRHPVGPVATVEVSALLVTSSELDHALVKRLTSTLFAHRSRLVGSEDDRLMVARRLREDFKPASSLMPYHPGASSYYRRSQPPFIVEYAETLSFILTVFVGVFSVSVAVREWMRRRMKNRIDDFYVEIDELTESIDGMSVEQLLAHRRDLRDLQRRAFAELVAERLEANQSFTIFQDYLVNEVAAIEARIAEKRRHQPG